MTDTVQTRKRLTDDERISQLSARKNMIENRLAALLKKQTQRSRKEDARRKVVLGAAVISMLGDAAFEPRGKAWLRQALMSKLSPRDRAIVADVLQLVPHQQTEGDANA